MIVIWVKLGKSYLRNNKCKSVTYSSGYNNTHISQHFICGFCTLVYMSYKFFFVRMFSHLLKRSVQYIKINKIKSDHYKLTLISYIVFIYTHESKYRKYTRKLCPPFVFAGVPRGILVSSELRVFCVFWSPSNEHPWFIYIKKLPYFDLSSLIALIGMNFDSIKLH